MPVYKSKYILFSNSFFFFMRKCKNFIMFYIYFMYILIYSLFSKQSIQQGPCYRFERGEAQITKWFVFYNWVFIWGGGTVQKQPASYFVKISVLFFHERLFRKRFLEHIKFSRRLGCNKKKCDFSRRRHNFFIRTHQIFHENQKWY